MLSFTKPVKVQGRRSGPKGGGGGGAEAWGRDECGGGEGRRVWQRIPQLIVKSAPVNCKADRLSAFCTSRAKMSAIRTRHDKTTLLVTKGDNEHFRTLRAITYKKIIEWIKCRNAGRSHVKKTPFAKKWGGGGKRPPCPTPSAAYEVWIRNNFATRWWQVGRSPWRRTLVQSSPLKQLHICALHTCVFC